MIVRLLGLVGLLVVITLGIGYFLAPDDLAKCDLESPQASGECASAGAIVVISGGDTMARTDRAIELFKSGWAPIIVFSGAAADKDGPSNAHVMRSRALSLGVPQEATIIEEQSETTRQNAEQVGRQLESRGVNDIILVTSGYHMRRASLEFSRHLPQIDIRRHPVANDQQWSQVWWLTPRGWGIALGELVKIALFYVGITR